MTKMVVKAAAVMRRLRVAVGTVKAVAAEVAKVRVEGVMQKVVDIRKHRRRKHLRTFAGCKTMLWAAY
jgi:hypothetical protein